MEAFIHLYPCLMKQALKTFNETTNSLQELSCSMSKLQDPFKRLQELSEKYYEEDV